MDKKIDVVSLKNFKKSMGRIVHVGKYLGDYVASFVTAKGSHSSNPE